jgi:proline iminopeptidase
LKHRIWRRLVSGGVPVVAVLGGIVACDVEPASFSPPVSEGTIQVDGAELYYKTVGTGEPIVIVHGGPGMDHSYLLPGFAGLAEQYRLVFYDQRALGSSTGEADSTWITFERFLEDLDQVRVALDLDRMTVLGHSWGGLLALRYAMEYPERVESLILVSSVEPGQRFQQAMMENQAARRTPEDAAALDSLVQSAAFQERDTEAVNRIFWHSFRSTFADPQAAADLVVQFSDRTIQNGSRVAGFLMLPLGAYDYWDRLQAVHVRTLVAHGAQDPIPLEMARELAGALPGGTLVALEGAGHFPFVETPGALFAAIDDFLKNAAADGGETDR